MNSDPHILRFCKENNLILKNIKKSVDDFIYSTFYQTSSLDSWNRLLSYDNSEMETDKDTYYYLSHESDRIYLYHSNSRGNLKLNYTVLYMTKSYINSRTINIDIDIIYSILVILQSIFPKIQINDRHQIRGELNMKIVHSLFYLIEHHRTPLCFDVPSEKRKALKLSEKRELAAKFNYQCDCCGDIIGDITRGTNEDHIRELQYFGTNDLSNFQLLCLDCHNYKTKLNKSKKRKLEDTNPTKSKRRKTNIASAP